MARLHARSHFSTAGASRADGSTSAPSLSLFQEESISIAEDSRGWPRGPDDGESRSWDKANYESGRSGCF